MLRAHTLIIVMVILAGGIVGVSAELSTEYSVDITDSVDIPVQTIDTERGEVTITEIGKVESGNFLSVSTNAPKNESYAIRIVDSQERNLARADGDGNIERSFFINDDPGIYAVILTQDSGNTALEVEPFIVKAYTIDQSVSDVTKGESISVSVQLTSVVDDPSDPQAVNVTLFGDDVTRSVEATETEIGENSYQAEFSTDGLSTGSYEVYTGIETNDDIFGYSELIGVSDSADVTVESIETPTATSTPEPGPPPETPTSPPDEVNETVNVNDGEAAVTFSSEQHIYRIQLSDLPEDVPRVSITPSSTNPSNGTGGLPSSDNDIGTFLNINPEDNIGNDISVNQDITVSVTVEDSVVSGIDDPVLYHDVNSDGTYSELDTEVSEVSNGTQLIATATGLGPFAVAEGPTSVVDEYDTDNDDDISITELGRAGTDFASGELTITELGQIGAEFAS